MPKKIIQETKAMKVTYPVWLGTRLIQPGETVTVPAELAQEWRETERAAYVTAEVKDGDGQDA